VDSLHSSARPFDIALFFESFNICPVMSALVQQFLKINQQEVTFQRRGFVGSSVAIQSRLENIGRVFLRGYHAALQDADQNVLANNLDAVDQEHRGFAFEGAAMALALVDGIGFKGDSLSRFIAGAGKQHVFMLHVGAGWAYARLPWKRWRIESAIRKLHPVLRWLVIDGYGFHEGYFHRETQIASSNSSVQSRPALRLSEDARHVFYQGLGRSLWFSDSADVRRISTSISRFPEQYHADAWSGIGLACAYAGGITQDAIAELRRESAIHAPAVAQGAAFAAKARQLAGNPAKHTRAACEILCQMSVEEAAALCDETFTRIDLLRPCPYQHWRKLLQQSLLSFTKLSSEILIRGKSNEAGISSPLAAAKHH
jgi:hypothetical protein